MKEKLTVGQKLWYVPTRKYNGDPRWVEVKRVGREYAYCGEDYWELKLRMSSMCVDDRGYCYLTEDEWRDVVEIRGAWKAFHEKVSREWGPPKGVTLAKIKEIRVILGYDPKPEVEKPTRDERATNKQREGHTQ